MFPRTRSSFRMFFVHALLPAALLLAAALGANQPALAGQIISIWNGGAGTWGTPANWTPVGVPNNGGGNTYDVRIDNGNAAASNVTLNISPTIDLLTVDAAERLAVANGSSLTIAGGGIANAGTISLNALGSYTNLRISGSDATLSGGGTISLSNSALNTILGTAGTERLINADNTIRGAGTISALLTNHGTVDATGILYLNTYAKINDGTFRASPGGTLMVDIGASGTGRWEAAGGKIQVGAVTVSTTGPISVTAGGELELNGSTMSGSNLTMDSTGIIDVNSTLALSGNLSFAMTDEAKWDWGTTAGLTMNGGVGAGAGHWADWASLEVGGTDLGTDPANHAGAAAGFSANFDLTKLTIGPGAQVYLADLFDNGNRGGAYGQGEALYVDTLTFSDAAGTLNLNGLNLYYSSTNAAQGQIINEAAPEPATLALLGAGAIAALVARRRVVGKRK